MFTQNHFLLTVPATTTYNHFMSAFVVRSRSTKVTPIKKLCGYLLNPKGTRKQLSQKNHEYTCAYKKHDNGNSTFHKTFMHTVFML